ncbi:MAG: hypothetical protein P4L40_05690 [Terracidiphilus sp.]|nr:hypothetical protein [Terracidiphilus sp.]
MATLSRGAVPMPQSWFSGRNSLLDRYFYLAMSLLIAGIVVWGFSHTVDASLFHPAVPRPFLLWIHGAAFSGWVVFYILQSALVRTRNVRIHRTLGWFGTALAASMVLLGLVIAVIMGHFDIYTLHQSAAFVEAFFAIPLYDMLAFGTLVGLAIFWRRKPELHRRLLFLASCGLLDAAFGRIDAIFLSHTIFAFVDAVILLGILRDLLVNRTIHPVYRYALPTLVVAQTVTTYLWVYPPQWWITITHAILS